ncbi:MAG: replication-associated recombination protein A, partial [Actinomycetota bacterium]|nr:replication-associated recombination protein A [Actinomycetota bacterium]
PELPAHLRSAGHPGTRALGHGEGYDYPHDRTGAVSPQRLMPEDAQGLHFLELSEQGEEPSMQERLERIRRARERPPG